jgi:hypothetical protein
VTVTLEDELDGSIATVTKIVFPTTTFAVEVTTRVFPVDSLSAVPIFATVLPMPLRIIRLRVPEGDETFPAASVAVAVMLCVPVVSATLGVRE